MLHLGHHCPVLCNCLLVNTLGNALLRNWELCCHLVPVIYPCFGRDPGNLLVGEQPGKYKLLYLALLTFVPIGGGEDRLVRSSRTNAFAWKDIRLLVSASEPDVRFVVNFDGEF